MANVLPHARRVEVVAHLVEGTSIRATSRLTGVSQPAILSLLVRMGEGCDRLHDRLVRDVDVREIQCDEIWSYVQKKQARVKPEDPAEWGDAYTFVANYRSGGRPDGQPSDHRYEPPRDPFITKIPMFGAPDMARASTSHIERQNLTMRMQIRRMTRLCNAFSRKIENHRAAVSLHFAWYNFCRIHESLRVTPAMEARVVGRMWTVDELVAAALAEPAGAPPKAKPLRLPEDPSVAVAAPSRELPGGRGFLRLVKGGTGVPPNVPPVPPAAGAAPANPRPMRQLDLFGPEDDK